ncbi:hypothetical protein [Nakamurella sp. PAMC28650]|uniref:hypothetical protein n=1 Tax=Nakamurella sp. PAMC28650 TaxID=2762325 RepID=UPI00164DB0EC|nr:hypothetical protein [Nakamurella sp. PAMC28650]QNK79312.1 hypothetical protein H7F38_13365 [Nakamurella sp. PAMC28650]
MIEIETSALERAMQVLEDDRGRSVLKMALDERSSGGDLFAAGIVAASEGYPVPLAEHLDGLDNRGLSHLTAACSRLRNRHAAAGEHDLAAIWQEVLLLVLRYWEQPSAVAPSSAADADWEALTRSIGGVTNTFACERA